MHVQTVMPVTRRTDREKVNTLKRLRKNARGFVIVIFANKLLSKNSVMLLTKLKSTRIQRSTDDHHHQKQQQQKTTTKTKKKNKKKNKNKNNNKQRNKPTGCVSMSALKSKVHLGLSVIVEKPRENQNICWNHIGKQTLKGRRKTLTQVTETKKDWPMCMLEKYRDDWLRKRNPHLN